jgi:hypothetical protein
MVSRETTPQTIYKRQRFDRDDIVDVTSFDMIAWVRAEMRMMLREEEARAILIGDGRNPSDPDKIKETNIRPIWKDDEVFAIHVVLPSTNTPIDDIDAMVAGQEKYKGSGNPDLFTTQGFMTKMLLQRDTIGRRLYGTRTELADSVGVGRVVPVEVMERQTRTGSDGTEYELVGIMVNLIDYNVGRDRGGQVTLFDQFDIDYNQQKYLIETRFSGALIRPYSAIVFERPVAAAG